MAARHRRLQIVSRCALICVAGAGLVGAVVTGSSALRGHRAGGLALSAAQPTLALVDPVPSAMRSAAGVVPSHAVVEYAAASPAPQPSELPSPAVPPAQPIVPEGRTSIGDSIMVDRSGSTVSVKFDAPLLRTRRADKFEGIVRATLPRIYGAVADSVLAKVPEGRLLRGADLLTDLPARGIRLALDEGWAFAIWPETRPGQDGPLVVAYRATITR
jgi:hypothetical protein